MAQQKKVDLPAVPHPEDKAGIYAYMLAMHDVVANLHSQAQQPNAPTSLVVTPIPGGNVVQFTRSNAITYQLYMGDTPDRGRATQVDLKSSNQYTDSLGAGGLTRYYWVVGLNQNGVPSDTLGPRSGVTLALSTPAPAIPRPVQSFAQVEDTQLGRLRPVISQFDTEVAGQPAPQD